MTEIPSFKKKEIAVELPEDEMELGSSAKETKAVVKYRGQDCINYKEGDTILFYKSVGKEIKYFEKPLWVIESENMVICKIEEK